MSDHYYEQATPTVDTIRTLAEAGCLYVTSAPASEVYHAAQEILPPELWRVSGWALLGQLDGKEWCACDTCGELRLMSPRKMKCPMRTTRASVLMPDCDGYMQRIVPRPRVTKKIRELIYR